MKRKLLIILAAVVALTTPLTPAANALDFSIAIGDRPYYHGRYYWHEGYRWVWVPGHYSHRRHRWIPGHYVRRGDYHRDYARRHFRHHRVWLETDWR